MNKKIDFVDIILLFVIYIIFWPVISFWFGYFMGWIAKLILGNILCKCFAIFGLIITPNQIPLITGLIGWLSSLFYHSPAVDIKR